MSDLWSVTVPGYATGAGTVLLVLVTAAVLWRDRRRDQDQALRDARKVFGIAVERQEPYDPAEGPETYRVQSIMLVNAGAGPIFNVGAGSIPIDIPGETTAQFTWSPGTHQSTTPFVLPGQREYLNGHWVEIESEVEPWVPADILYWMYPHLPVLVSWTDGRGERWERVRSNEPRRIKDGG